MKTIKFYAMLAICLMACSCEKFAAEQTSNSQDSKDKNVTLSLTQSNEVKEVCKKVSFAIFKVDEKLGVINQNFDDKDFGTIHLSLSPGIYRLVAIGHNGTGNCTISAPEKITFPSNKLTDTFSYYGTTEVVEGENTSESLTLKRAVAMLRLAIKDDIPSSAKRIKFYYTGGSSTLDATSGYGCVNSKQTETLDLDPQQKVYEVYTFPHEDGKKLTVNISVLNDEGITIASATLNDVEITKNYITTYSGKLFGNISEGGSGSIDIDFEFDAEWAGENNYEF